MKKFLSSFGRLDLLNWGTQSSSHECCTIQFHMGTLTSLMMCSGLFVPNLVTRERSTNVLSPMNRGISMSSLTKAVLKILHSSDVASTRNVERLAIVKPRRLNLWTVAQADRERPTLGRPTSGHSRTSLAAYRMKLTPLRTYEAKCDAVVSRRNKLS